MFFSCFEQFFCNSSRHLRRWENSCLFCVKEMKKKFGIGDIIPELKKEDIPKLSRYADKEANPLYPVPVKWDLAHLEKAVWVPIMEKTVSKLFPMLKAS